MWSYRSEWNLGQRPRSETARRPVWKRMWVRDSHHPFPGFSAINYKSEIEKQVPKGKGAFCECEKLSNDAWYFVNKRAETEAKWIRQTSQIPADSSITVQSNNLRV